MTISFVMQIGKFRKVSNSVDCDQWLLFLVEYFRDLFIDWLEFYTQQLECLKLNLKMMWNNIEEKQVEFNFIES